MASAVGSIGAGSGALAATSSATGAGGGLDVRADAPSGAAASVAASLRRRRDGQRRRRHLDDRRLQRQRFRRGFELRRPERQRDVQRERQHERDDETPPRRPGESRRNVRAARDLELAIAASTATRWRGGGCGHEFQARDYERGGGHAFVLNVDAAAVDDEPARAERAHGRRQQPMLDREHARGERRFVVAVVHGDGALRDDRPVVERRGHEVHGAAVDAHAVRQRAAMGVEPRIRGQQRRMDVEHPPFVAPDELRAEDAHEAREHDEVGLRRVDRRAERRVERIALGIGGVRTTTPGTPCAAATSSAGIAAPIADDGGDRSFEPALALGVEQRAQVRAAAGGEDGDAGDGHGAIDRRRR